jgi:hypothetical protein
VIEVPKVKVPDTGIKPIDGVKKDAQDLTKGTPLDGVL